MLARTYTAMMVGLDPIRVEVEVDGSHGVPALILIGLTSKATAEAKERMTSALQNCGIRMRSKRTIVNLAPADVPKISASFDLAIAVGLLKMYGEIALKTDDALFFGELALDGQLKPVHGALPLVLAAKQFGFQCVIFPRANLGEVETIHGITLRPVATLQEFLKYAKRDALPPQHPAAQFPISSPSTPSESLEAIVGQLQAKRALTIAAAGSHNLLLVGPPGAGKSLLARALISLLPPLSEEEALEVTQVHSVCGLTQNQLITKRPFRPIHHSISLGGLLGGGTLHLRPGEISLAHRGVLFADELLEFPAGVIDTLRQPLEERTILVSRVSGSTRYPASFMLVAATNPCPCGYAGSKRRTCHCSNNLRERYWQRLSGPFLDRIDVCVTVPEVALADVTSPVVRDQHETRGAQQQIATALRQQQLRFRSATTRNAWISHHQIFRSCRFAPAALTTLQTLGVGMQLSVRSYHKTARVARTIADLEASEVVEPIHVAEAFQYRFREHVLR